MRKIYYIFILSVFAFWTSCQKDLDIDYTDIEPVYVIQGHISDEPAQVLLTKTRNMNDGNKGKGVNDAEIELSDDKGKSENLVFGADGYYHSPSGWTGETGRTYTLKVKINGKEYKASSTMTTAVALDSIKFAFLSTAGIDMVMLKYFTTYPKEGDLSFTHFFVTKNGEPYRTHTGKQINPQYIKGEAMVGCTTKQVMEEYDPEKQDAIIHEGDKIHCELWTIDSPVYDYLHSISTSQSNATNPLTNFTNGVTGYFSAHHTRTIDFVFNKKMLPE